MSDTDIIIESILQAIVAGVSVGAIYGLMCVGLGMIFGIMRVINFAQGDFMMLGMYAAYYVLIGLGIQTLFGNIAGPYVAVILVGPLLFVFGWGVHRLLVRQVTGVRTADMEAEGHYAQLILTLGIALVLQNGAMIVFGAELLSVKTPLASQAWVLEPFFGGEMLLFFNKARMVAAAFSVVIIVLLWLAITRTRLGKSLRAAADNPEASTYMGINVDRAHRIAFGVGTAVTAMAGGLLATSYPFHPFVGLEYVIVMYAGVVLGGIGSTLGAFWGGMTIGLVQQLSILVLPQQLQNATIFVVFLIIVTLRPQGFFGRVTERT